MSVSAGRLREIAPRFAWGMALISGKGATVRVLLPAFTDQTPVPVMMALMVRSSILKSSQIDQSLTYLLSSLM
jgi:hypothetical protein